MERNAAVARRKRTSIFGTMLLAIAIGENWTHPAIVTAQSTSLLYSVLVVLPAPKASPPQNPAASYTFTVLKSYQAVGGAMTLQRSPSWSLHPSQCAKIKETNVEITEGVYKALADPKKKMVPPTIEAPPPCFNCAPRLIRRATT